MRRMGKPRGATAHPILLAGKVEMALEQLRVFVAVERQHVTPRITKNHSARGRRRGPISGRTTCTRRASN
jgi:hypothetical protein